MAALIWQHFVVFNSGKAITVTGCWERGGYPLHLDRPDGSEELATVQERRVCCLSRSARMCTDADLSVFHYINLSYTLRPYGYFFVAFRVRPSH